MLCEGNFGYCVENYYRNIHRSVICTNPEMSKIEMRAENIVDFAP